MYENIRVPPGKANTSDTKASFLDLHLSISNDIVSTKIHDKRDDLDFEIVNFPFLDGGVPRSTSYGVYISQLVRFARASSYLADFICALWSPAGKGLTSWLSFVVSSVSLSLSHWYPGSCVVLDCIDS